jgi:hypothetical protein
VCLKVYRGVEEMLHTLNHYTRQQWKISTSLTAVMWQKTGKVKCAGIVSVRRIQVQ